MIKPGHNTWARLVRFAAPTLHPDTVLVLLLARAGMHARWPPLSRMALLAALPRCEGLASRGMDVYVSRLRQRLALEGVLQLHVNMVQGCGYALRGVLDAAGDGTLPNAMAG